MTHAELERAVARQTGESLRTIRQRGFGPDGPRPAVVPTDAEPDAVSDHDQYDPHPTHED